MPELTPMMKQYQEIKSQTDGAILMFRLGDFYEMFGDDAELASKELEITLTGRGAGENRSPMCGVPYHSIYPYISKLISKGYKVAICEQMEDPALAKGIVKRQITRIITPGTITDQSMLVEKSNNYLMAISSFAGKLGLAYVDASTGLFKSLDIKNADQKKTLFDEIERIAPSECLVGIDLYESDPALVKFLESRNIIVTKYTLKDIFDAPLATEKLKRFFAVKSLEGFGFSGDEASLCASSSIIDYLNETQKTSLGQINKISPYNIDSFMSIDPSTRKNLELVETIKDRSFKGSLLSILDRTATPMGARKLRSWLLYPLKDDKEINSRLDGVEELSKDPVLRQRLLSALNDIRDIERLSSRIAGGSANARDLVSLKESLLKLPEIKKLLSTCSSSLLRKASEISDMSAVLTLISAAITDDPPFTIKEGGMIKKGYSAELDEIKEASTNGKKWISALEESERQRTGIKSLKVGFTKVFGYYIEITSSNLKYAPQDYIRKQTLVNCERFITPDLKEKEAMILNAEERLTDTEYSIFCGVRDETAKHIKDLQNIADLIAVADAVLSLANTAAGENYVRPVIVDALREAHLQIISGRHPVVENTIGRHLFVPNDTTMDDNGRFIMLTGPNMAGKSTYMRQVALIVLLAQIGSFVPAKSATIPLADRIFT
ncbi:MAG: DNA mismatch repair protein MutS, partial [Candidatus Margulisiibacteriota bacterium]